jgi:predicted nucleotidyltransferase
MQAILGKISLNYNEQIGIEGITSELTEKYPFIKKIILYGSKARGDFSEDSDIDLLFVIDQEITRSVKFEIYDIIHKYELDNDIVVSAIFVSESDFNTKLSLLLKGVKKEGITLWLKE